MAHPANTILIEESWNWFSSSRLHWPETQMSTVDLDNWWTWRRRDIDLYQSDVTKKIDAIGGIRDVVQGLESLGQRRREEIVPIVGGRIADRIPWEALESRFIDRSIAVHPVRADPTLHAVPADRRGPLRIALLVGHEGKDAAFERDRQLAQLTDALKASAQVNARVVDAHALKSLDLAASSDADRQPFLADADPHVVLYFGHGTAGRRPGVLIGPDRWLPLDELAADAVNDRPYPVSWVFIACSIGEAPSRDTGPAGPEAFRILAKRGARAMLAMRARIRPALAQIVATSLIESLSAGVPLERAAATARKAARRHREAGGATLLDWAAPAVWSTAAGEMPPRASKDVPAQLVAQRLSRAGADDPGIGLGAPDPDVTQTAKRWLAERRVRVDLADGDEPSSAALLAKVCGAMTALSSRTTLFVRAQGYTPFVARLADWAAIVYVALDLAERETDMGRAVRQLAKRDLSGLESLLGISEIVVVFSSPPDTGDHNAWTVIDGASADTTIILGYPSRNQAQRPGWTLDRLDMPNAPQITADALAKYPRTLAVLSVLESPAALEAVAEIADEPSAEIASTGIAINMPGGVVLAPGAREVVRDGLTPMDITQAHRCVFEARQRVPALIESDDVFAPVRDLVGAQAKELPDFVNALANRFHRHWTETDWLRLGRALEPARDRWIAVTPNVLLEIAHALVRRQSLKPAEPWLQEIEKMDVKDPVLTARRFALQSEIAKGEGTPRGRERMWRDAHSALQYAGQALTSNPSDIHVRSLERDMRANLARLELYFHRDAEVTKGIFEAILAQLNDEDETRVAPSIVSTLRNLAECLFEFEPFRDSAERRTEARGHLVRADAIARKHHVHDVGAEVLYTAAKLDATEKDWAAAHDHLIAAIDRARFAGHTVCQRIADMRLFWLGVHHEGAVFDHTLFLARLRKLEFVESHAWARRYAAQARLWAARELERHLDYEGMRLLLTRTITAFEPLNRISSGADRRFVALSYAGMLKAGDSQSWPTFQTLNWSASWINENAVNDPLVYWEKGTQHDG